MCKTPIVRVFLVIAVLVAMPCAHAASPKTWSRIVGNFCIEGIPDTAKKIERTENNNGIVIEQFDIDYKAGTSSYPAMMRVFREEPKATNVLTPCSQLQGEVVLQGRIKELRIRRARATVSNTPSYFEVGGVPGSELKVELTRVDSSLAPLYGGNLQLGGQGGIGNSRRAWLSNVGAILTSTGAASTGALDIETWGRHLTGAKLQLPGSDETHTVNLSAGNTNIVIRSQVDGSGTELMRGALRGGPFTFQLGVLGLPAANLEGVVLKAAALELSADERGASLNLMNLHYTATGGALGSPDTVARLSQVVGTGARLSSSVPRTGEHLAFTAPELLAHVANGRDCVYAHSAVELTAANTCSAQTARANRDGFAMEFVAQGPTSTVVKEALAAAGQMRWSLSHANGVDTLKGSFERPRATLGALQLDAGRADFEQPFKNGPVLEIPFSVSIGPASGSWGFSTEPGRVVINGQLDELLLRGAIGIPLEAPDNWTIRIRKDDFRFGGGVSTELQPHIHGGTPLLAAGTQLAFHSDSELTISRLQTNGSVYTRLSVFALSNMDIELGQGAEALVVEGPLRFEAGVELAYLLENGTASIRSGKIDMKDLHVRTKPNQMGDFGPVRVLDADFQVARIAAEFHPAQQAGTIEINDVRLAVGAIEQKPDVGADQLRWAGDLAEPFTVNALRAKVAPDQPGGALELRDVSLENISLVLAQPRLGQGDALRFRGHSLSLAFDLISDAEVRGKFEMVNANIVASEDEGDIQLRDVDLVLVLTGGPLDAPNGHGRLASGPADVKLDADMKIEFEACEGEPRFRSLPVRIEFHTESLAMPLTIQAGRLNGRGEAGVSHSFIKNTGTYDCPKQVVDWPIVKEVRAKFEYPCPTWKKPLRMCDGWTTLVPEVRVGVDRQFKIRNLYAAGIFKEVGIEISAGGESRTKFKRCFRSGVFLPLIDVSYYVKPRTSIHVADKIIDEMTDVFARPLTTALVSGLTASISNVLMNHPLSQHLLGGLCV